MARTTHQTRQCFWSRTLAFELTSGGELRHAMSCDTEVHKCGRPTVTYASATVVN